MADIGRTIRNARLPDGSRHDIEIRDGRVTWRPAIDVTRVLVMALILAIALVRARGRRRR